MAVENRTQLKTYFQLDDFPTEGQFANFIDSCFNLNDDSFLTKIGTASGSVTGLLSNIDWTSFNSKVTFPGFGTSHSTAAYGDHVHSTLYEPVLGTPSTSGYVLSSTNMGVRSWVAMAGGSMTYPAAGIPLSTGSSWDTSIVNNSANWNTAYSWGNHASAGYLTTVPIATAMVLGGVKIGDNISVDANGVISTAANPSARTAGDVGVGYLNYNSTTQVAGQFDGGTTNPSHTTRLNYDGYLYATKIYSNNSQVVSSLTTSLLNGSSILTGDLTIAPGTSPNNGNFYTGTSNPSNTTRLNYDGYLYSTRFYGNIECSYINAVNFGTASYAGSFFSRNAISLQAGLNNNVTANNAFNILKLTRETDSSIYNITGDIISIIDNPTTSGTISGKVLSATIGSTERISLNPRAPSTGSAVAYMFDTHNALASGDKLLSVRNQNSEKSYVDYNGNIGCNSITRASDQTSSVVLASGDVQLSASGYVLGHFYGTANIELKSNVSDGVNNIAYKLNTYNTLTAAGSKLISVQNNTVERFRVTPTTTDIGDIAGGNYTSIESDGTIVFNGTATVWRDELTSAVDLQQTGVGISKNTTEVTVDYLSSATTADYMYTNVQLNHDRKSNSVIHPHIHWFQEQANTPNWLLQYRIQLLNSAKITAWTNYQCNTNAFTYTSGTLHQISYGAGITVNGSVSDIVQFRIIRDTTNVSTLFGADPYTATVAVMAFDNHIQCDSVGSRTEYTK